MARQDRFKPLSNYPKHEATKDRPAVMGLPTKAENTLLFGSCDTNKNPCDMQALLGDTEKPAEDVLLDAKVSLQTADGVRLDLCSELSRAAALAQLPASLKTREETDHTATVCELSAGQQLYPQASRGAHI